MPYLKSYDPLFHIDRKSLLRNRHAQLAGLRGQTLQSVWLVMHTDGASWVRECPVVLRFDNAQVEVCAKRVGEYSITFDEIDLEESLEQSSEGSLVEWQQCRSDVVTAVEGKVVNGVFIAHSPPDPTEDNCELIHALEFSFSDGGYLSLYNALDENGIDSRTFGDDTLVSPVG